MSRHPAFAATQVCVFDAYGTLLDVAGMAARFKDALGDKTAALMDLWRRKQLEYSWLRSLMGRYTDFWHATGEALDYAMEIVGLVDPSLRSRLMEAWLDPRLYPEVPAMLERLQAAGFKTAILSNGSVSMLTAGVSVTGLGPRLDAVLSVDQAGVFKPHPSVYKLATDRFGVEPRSVCFVSGNGWDVAGASAFGFQVAWVNRAGAPAERLPGGGDAVIATLAELPPLLGA